MKDRRLINKHYSNKTFISKMCEYVQIQLLITKISANERD